MDEKLVFASTEEALQYFTDWIARHEDRIKELESMVVAQHIVISTGLHIIESVGGVPPESVIKSIKSAAREGRQTGTISDEVADTIETMIAGHRPSGEIIPFGQKGS